MEIWQIYFLIGTIFAAYKLIFGPPISFLLEAMEKLYEASGLNLSATEKEWYVTIQTFLGIVLVIAIAEVFWPLIITIGVSRKIK